jgi:hypothetical protein
LQDKKTGGIYYAFDGTKAPIWDAVFLKTKFKNKKIIPVSPEELKTLTTVDPVRFGDGELLRSPISPAVYVISQSKKKPVVSADAFLKLGYKWENVLIVPRKIIDLYADGDPIADETAEPAPTAPSAPETSSTTEEAPN